MQESISSLSDSSNSDGSEISSETFDEEEEPELNLTNTQQLLLAINNMVNKFIYTKALQDKSIDPNRFETNFKYSKMWFNIHAQSRKNKEEYYYGPYCSQDKELWIKTNKLRKARLLRELHQKSDQFKHLTDKQLTMKIFKIGKMHKNFKNKLEYQNFIGNLIQTTKEGDHNMYMQFDK